MESGFHTVQAAATKWEWSRGGSTTVTPAIPAVRTTLQKCVLFYQLVQEYWPVFEDQLVAQDTGLPGYVKQ